MIQSDDPRFTLSTNENDPTQGFLQYDALSEVIPQKKLNDRDRTYKITVQLLDERQQQDFSQHWDEKASVLKTRGWKPLTLRKGGKDQIVLMNIDSATKCLKALGVKSEVIDKALESGDFSKNVEKLVLEKKRQDLTHFLKLLGEVPGDLLLKPLVDFLLEQIVRGNLTMDEIKAIFHYSPIASKRLIKLTTCKSNLRKSEKLSALKQAFRKLQKAYQVDQLLQKYLVPVTLIPMMRRLVMHEMSSFSDLQDLLKDPANHPITTRDDCFQLIESYREKKDELFGLLNKIGIQQPEGIWPWIQEMEISLKDIKDFIKNLDPKVIPIKTAGQLAYLMKWDICRKVKNILKHSQSHWLAEARAKASASSRGVRIKAKDHPELPRSIQVTPSGEIYVLFNKLRLGDQVLGTGSFKTVKTSMNIETGEIFARPTQASTEDAMAELQMSIYLTREAQKDRQKGILHTHTCSLIETENVVGKRKIGSMQQLCSGGDLAFALGADSKGVPPFPITREEKLLIAYRLLDAVNWLHAQGILHLDIKLENLMLGRDENNRITDASLGDFGLSCSLDDKKRRKRAGGTPKYTSPELMLASVRRDPRRIENANQFPTDNWSVGVVLFLLFRKDIPGWCNFLLPWFDSKVEDLVKNLIQLPNNWLPDPKSNNPIIPIIQGLLQPKPESRIDTEKALKLLKLCIIKDFPGMFENIS